MALKSNTLLINGSVVHLIINRKKQQFIAKIDVSDAEKLQTAGAWHLSHKDSKGSEGFYAARKIPLGNGKYKHETLHNFIAGEPPEGFRWDHINGDGLDNRRENLRLATAHQNQCNRGKQKNNSTGYKGVSKTPAGRWEARIQVHKKLLHLGTYDTPELAHEVYCQAAEVYHGKFAKS